LPLRGKEQQFVLRFSGDGWIYFLKNYGGGLDMGVLAGLS